MTTKPYKYDEAEAGKPQCVSEPVVSYVASREEEDLMPGGIPALQFTKEELNAHIDKSLQDIAEGHVCTSAEVHRRMEEKFPFLCK
ncbi:hypothetical protein [Parabacteroides bouchesdurhonensis]|uniref:hypothetical protein n=1 Tax=Parabacteroides bouchesdurhonensis TaxID=1936995 RepID=UPI00131B3792|nr:hypothetical protein [Parabacteroides bouchesdurhonensis]